MENIKNVVEALQTLKEYFPHGLGRHSIVIASSLYVIGQILCIRIILEPMYTMIEKYLAWILVISVIYELCCFVDYVKVRISGTLEQKAREQQIRRVLEEKIVLMSPSERERFSTVQSGE